MAEFDLLIIGGTIVDGTRIPRFCGDIAIRNGQIARIAPPGAIVRARADQVIDATGKIVAPGVIDPHTHYDAQIFWDPYCADSSWHGNTSLIVGNCGFGFMPCHPEHRERYMLMMENTEQIPMPAMRDALPWNWESFPEWLDRVRQINLGVNIAAYMPLNSLMIYVMGLEAAKSRGATDAERLEMRRLLNEAMDAGAIGFSFSFVDVFNSHKDIDGSPMPTDTMQIEDAYYLAEVLRERGEGVIQVLSELPPGIASRCDAIEELARISGRPIFMNIIMPIDSHPEYHRGLLNWLDEMEAKQLNIYGQAFIARTWNQLRPLEYDVWQGVSKTFRELSVAKPAENMIKVAADPSFVERAVAEYDPQLWISAGGALESYRLLDPRAAQPYEKYKGEMMGDIARAEGRHVVEVFLDIVAKSDAVAEFRTTAAASEDPLKCAEILRHKRVLPGTSDGGGHVKFHTGGQYATDNIMWLVREQKLLSLEDVHYHLSYLPARAFGFANRGALLEGMAADLYIYDLETIGYDRERHQMANILPRGDWRWVCYPKGIEWVVVNGQPILHNNEVTGATPGTLIGVRGEAFDTELLPFREAAE